MADDGAPRDPGFAAGFGLGFAAAFRGIGRLAARPAWWPLAAAPAVVTAAGAGLFLSVGAGAASDWISSRLPPDGWARTAFEWFFGPFFVVTAALALLFVYAPLVRTLAAPFLALLADRAVADASGAETPASPGSRVVRWVLRPLGEALVLLAARLVWMAAAAPLLCVPVVGAFLWAAALLPFEGFDLLDVAVGARGKVLRERVAFARRHAGATVGLGLAKTAILLVPCLNLFLLPGTVVGAVLLDRRLSDDFPGGRERTA